MEKPVSFENNGEALRGILHVPDRAATAGGTGVIFLHGWPGNRIGPHRMFVATARRLTSLGCHCLRFDFRGRGESDGNTADATIRSMISDTNRAVDFLLAQSQIETVILLGICSGGKVAIGEASADPRISRLVLWSAESMGHLRPSSVKAAKSLHSLRAYLNKLRSPDTWRKILTFKVNTRMIRKAVLSDESPDKAEIKDESRMLDQFKAFKGKILFIYGGNDPAVKLAARKYEEFFNRSGIGNTVHEIAGANHSFYSLEWERQVIDLTEKWISAHISTQSCACGQTRR